MNDKDINLDEMKSIHLINSLTNTPLDLKDSTDYGDLPFRVLPELGKSVIEQKLNGE